MRILQEDVADFIEATLLNIRSGLAAAASEGIVIEDMPKEIPFSLEIVHAAQSLESVTEAEQSAESEESGTQEETQTEDPTEDSEETVRDAEDATEEGGGDVETSTYTYGEYTEE